MRDAGPTALDLAKSIPQLICCISRPAGARANPYAKVYACGIFADVIDCQNFASSVRYLTKAGTLPKESGKMVSIRAAICPADGQDYAARCSQSPPSLHYWHV